MNLMVYDGSRVKASSNVREIGLRFAEHTIANANNIMTIVKDLFISLLKKLKMLDNLYKFESTLFHDKLMNRLKSAVSQQNKQFYKFPY